MIIIMGMDGLEYNYVKDWNLTNLMQETYGKTDISDYKDQRTIVLWSSFLSGRNTETDALAAPETVKVSAKCSLSIAPERTFCVSIFPVVPSVPFFRSVKAVFTSAVVIVL